MLPSQAQELLFETKEERVWFGHAEEVKMMEGWHMLLAVWNGAKPKRLDEEGTSWRSWNWGGLGGTGGGLGGTLGILSISRDMWSQMTHWGMAVEAHSLRS